MQDFATLEIDAKNEEIRSLRARDENLEKKIRARDEENRKLKITLQTRDEEILAYRNLEDQHVNLTATYSQYHPALELKTRNYLLRHVQEAHLQNTQLKEAFQTAQALCEQ